MPYNGDMPKFSDSLQRWENVGACCWAMAEVLVVADIHLGMTIIHTFHILFALRHFTPTNGIYVCTHYI